MIERDSNKNPWYKNYGLGILLLVLFLVSWLGQFGAQAFEIASQNLQHGQAVSVWTVIQTGDFWSQFLAATFENWQSEFLQLLTMVVATKFFIFRGSSESRDSDDRMEQKIDEIARAVGVDSRPDS